MWSPNIDRSASGEEGQLLRLRTFVFHFGDVFTLPNMLPLLLMSVADVVGMFSIRPRRDCVRPCHSVFDM